MGVGGSDAARLAVAQADSPQVVAEIDFVRTAAEGSKRFFNSSIRRPEKTSAIDP